MNKSMLRTLQAATILTVLVLLLAKPTMTRMEFVVVAMKQNGTSVLIVA